MDYLVSCNHLVKIVKVYMLPFCGEIKMNNRRQNPRKEVAEGLKRPPSLISHGRGLERYFCRSKFKVTAGTYVDIWGCIRPLRVDSAGAGHTVTTVGCSVHFADNETPTSTTQPHISINFP